MGIAIISEKLFKENSPVKEDTIINKFIPYILLAQKLHIKDVLGDSLLTELQEQVKAASVDPKPPVNPITPANRALIQEIAPALSFYAVYQGLPFHWAAIVNKGVTILESENSKGVDLKDISTLRKWVKDDAETLTRNLVSYLCKCSSKYPKWSPAEGYGCGGCGCCQGAKGVQIVYDTGIFIPKRRKKNCC